MPDKLDLIMRMQADFQYRTPDGVVPYDETTADITMRSIRTQTLACARELFEALDETGWKPWASSDHINLEGFRSELIDAFRFLMNLMIISGMSPDDVLKYYQASMDKTNARVELGYTGLNKCPACKRAYDDKHVGCHMYDNENQIGWCESKQIHTNQAGEAMTWGVAGWSVSST
jgi:dUTPase